MVKKVLIISYYWPPSGGAGVQRWLKFAKYLPVYGWEPVILTVDKLNAAYPVTDKSLENEIPPDLKVYSTPARDYFALYKKDRSKIPSAGFASNMDESFKGKLIRFVRGNFFIPDPRRGWNRFAYRKAAELIRQFDIKHIITTSPPHSTQLIGLRIKKNFPETRWIADLRDPWTDIYYYKQFYPTLLSRFIDVTYEKSVLKKADNIITVGESLRKLYSTKTGKAAKKISVLSNGFDDDDFRKVKAIVPDVFTITYVGTLSDNYPIDGLMDALRQMSEKGINFLLRFIGTVSYRQKNLITSSLDDKCLDFRPYAEHPEAIGYMKHSSMLLLIIPDHESNRSILTGKIFEYLAAEKPVLCLGPVDGDAAAILRSAGRGETCGYNDTAAISSNIMDAMKGNVPAMKDISEYSRKSLSERLAHLLQQY